jgi:two-component system, OmpR family, response regulator
MKILVVEDERRLASFLDSGLRKEGYAVEHASTGAQALARVHRAQPDLVVLDLGLPDVDGTEVLDELRRMQPSLPVVVLTARGDVEARVESLDLGADDYVTKPFALEELVARIRARLRKNGRASNVLEAGGIRLDLRLRRAAVDGREVELSAREFALLATFLRHPDQVLSREQLLSHVWGLHFDPGSNVVDVYIRYLRQKLGAQRITTVRRIGYRLERAS